METPETIRLSLQQGEWITSLDFSDAYFHIPIAQRSRKYLRFHLNKVTYQFQALPYGLATAPLEFTKVVKEVKLKAQARGWVVNMKKSELTPQQVFNFIGYWFDLKTSRVLLTQDRWSGLLAQSVSSCL